MNPNTYEPRGRTLTVRTRAEETPEKTEAAECNHWTSFGKSLTLVKQQIDRCQRKTPERSAKKEGHRREKTVRVVRESEGEGENQNGDLGKLVTWEGSQKILKQCRVTRVKNDKSTFAAYKDYLNKNPTHRRGKSSNNRY